MALYHLFAIYSLEGLRVARDVFAKGSPGNLGGAAISDGVVIEGRDRTRNVGSLESFRKRDRLLLEVRNDELGERDEVCEICR